MILLLRSMGHRATLKMRPWGAVGDGPLCRSGKGGRRCSLLQVRKSPASRASGGSRG